MNANKRSLLKEPIRVLFVAKHKMVQDGFKLLIESSDEVVVTAVKSFSDSFKRSEFSPLPEVAVVSLAHSDAVDVITKLLKNLPNLRVVVIAARDDLDLQARALELGAVGIVNEDQSPSLLIEAIRQTHAGDTWLNQVVLSKVFQKKNAGRAPSAEQDMKFDPESGTEILTSRELEVLDLIGTGLKNKQIAEKLLISEPTVRCHLSSIYGKLGVKDRLNLVIKAYQIGLLEF
ncbi:MAG: DNA-binding response regulator [Acidobacteria bacterium]|nr:MAG: DNA-binding response regulator [Acidobacteriota bacterium]REK01500.1 MAG: DNA-binding response regulator [Acidobacteriota bacterium]REK14456.1 MAG: DNA-binding response regulator [Acidobacteriota bacterium]REK45171.1 MAG: DNA-binding response regulator [Acidobacteriota bacterium]